MRVKGLLDAAPAVAHMDIPGFRLHPLKGRLKGLWAVTVRANWRVIFRFDGGVEDVEALGVTRNTLSELVNGKRGISPEMAVRLAKVFGGTEQGWIVQQAQYDLAQVHRDRLKDLKRLEVA